MNRFVGGQMAASAEIMSQKASTRASSASRRNGLA